jgi:hypothetical protein
MAIYDFPKVEKSNVTPASMPESEKVIEEESSPKSLRDRIFSTLAARLFFLLLIAADVLWVCYAVLQLFFAGIGYCCTGGKAPYFKALSEKAYVTMRRSLICGVSLIIALFSPAFGIMIACTYFLMYDKTGIEEVVPTSLQSQFKEFIPGMQSES